MRGQRRTEERKNIILNIGLDVDEKIGILAEDDCRSRSQYINVLIRREYDQLMKRRQEQEQEQEQE